MMADIYCPICGEPWDIAEFSFEENPAEARRRFATEGCTAFDGGTHNTPINAARAVRARIALDLFGDDFDGISAVLDES